MSNAYCGFRSFHYCLRTANAVPKALPGAIRLTRDPETDDIKIAPDIPGAPTEYTVGFRDKGIKLNLEIVTLPQAFLTDVLGFTTSSGVLIEGEHPLIHFALLFETQNAGGEPVRHSYLDCVCKKPKFDVSTLGRSPKIETRKLEIIANKDIFGSGAYKKSVTAAQNSSMYNGWFYHLY